MGSRTTIRDVAEWVGVSSATVSNVINGKKKKVSESTRKEVWRAIQKLDYRPTATRQTEYQDGPQKSLGVVIREIHNPYFSDVIVGAQQRAHEMGHSLMISSSEGERDSEEAIVELFMEKGVDGMILNPLLDRDADFTHLFELKRRNIPLVLLEQVRGIRSNLVDVNNVQAARTITGHLFDLGHERVIHFAGPEHSMHGGERTEGFRRAFFGSQTVFSESYVVRAGARLEDGYEMGRSYFRNCDESNRPTAVTCYNDLVAIGVIRALQELGIAVPEEVSVTGFDNIETGEYAPVPLTTMNVPTLEMGRTAVDILMRHLEAEENQKPEVIRLETEMIERASTAPVQKKVGA